MKTSMSSIFIFVSPLAVWVRGQPVDDRSRTHACERPHTLRAVPLISGHQRPAAAGDFRPRIIYGQGQDTRAHSSWPSPGPPGTTNKVTGRSVALRPPPSVFSSGQLLWAVLDWLFDWLFWLLDCWQPPLWAGSQAQRLDRPGQAGCQGEVGSACSMAADGVAEFLGGRLTQVENATRMAQ